METSSKTTSPRPRKPRRESLRQRLAIIARDGLLSGLDGCPVGGWPETRQALLRLSDELPRSDARSYSTHDLVDALYTVDETGRYRRCDETAGGAR